MSSESHKPTIQIRLFGGDALPENVSVRTLAEITSAVQQLSQSKLYLMRVKRSSAIYLFMPSEHSVAFRSLQQGKAALQAPENHLAKWMLKAFDKLAEIATQFRCNVEICSLADQWKWRFISDEWHAAKSRALMRDEATLTGILVRVGGSTGNKCGIKVSGYSKMKICTLKSEELARRLGEHLYEEVTLRGIGHFLTRDLSLFSFQVDDFTLVRRGTFEDAHRAIRQAGTGWDLVADPLSEIQGMR